MAVQTAGAIAFLVVGTPLFSRVRDFLWRFAAALPASWMVYTTGTVTRGGLAAVGASVGLLGLVSARTRNWVPFLAGVVVMAAIIFSGVSLPAPSLVAVGPTPRGCPDAQSERYADAHRLADPCSDAHSFADAAAVLGTASSRDHHSMVGEHHQHLLRLGQLSTRGHQAVQAGLVR